MNLIKAAKGKRIEYLDSVRGIAAMMVVVYHFIGWKWGDKLEYHLLSFVFNGADAVSFFFVLSGFVLSFKYFRSDREIQIKKFTVNRIFRLYPAFMFTVFINYLYWSRNDLSLSFLFNDLFKQVNMPLIKELVMVRGSHQYYIPGWTLGVEMALSLLMPLLTIVAKRKIQLIVWFIPLSLFMGAGYLSMFSMHFCLGIILAYYFEDIKNFDFKASKYYSYRWLIGLGVFLLYSIRHIERIQDFGKIYYKIAGFLSIDFFHYTGFASFLILLFVINNKGIQQLLNSRIFRFIGKISYSIYLMHWLIVVYVMNNWETWMSFFGSFHLTFVSMLILVVLATIVSATIVYYAIEEPFMKWGKRITANWQS